MITLEPPAHAGSRQQANALLDSLGIDLRGQTVTLDCSGLTVGSPSFLDEIVKQVLVVRHASVLDVVGAAHRTRALLQRSADNRGVADRVRIAMRAA